jgi:DNA gyrase/topoisomerase IV subunit A
MAYALSVITSRALPDVRDGLKPVQRRILYAMSHNLHLRPDARHRKSAAIVGEVMAKYHPHGDQSIYDAMVRLAQPFSQLHMLVDGQGNFGSLDGDPPAAMRYTEAKLRPWRWSSLEELGQHTVDLRPNYDGQYFEPVVLPARFPQLLVNGCEGIAVGMATRVPPHNLREVLDAPVNLTCLVPTDGGVPAPMRLDLKEILRHWSKFRFDTTRRRFEFQLKKLRERIHILEGFAIVFDALDEVIAIIRKSEGKRDAAEKLMKRFALSEIQTDAILSLRLYHLARLEIQAIRDELAEKLAEAHRIEEILGSGAALWGVVRAELLAVKQLYGRPRRSELGTPAAATLTYQEETYIVDEDTFVVVTRDGWFKRQSSFTDLSRIRIREDDTIGWLVKAGTRSTLTFLSNHGGAYVLRVDDVPQTTGYGEPIQARFSFDDGEKIVGVLSHDARHRLVAEGAPRGEDEPDPPWAVAITERGRVLRFALAAHAEPSNKSGRRFAKLDDGDVVLAVLPCDGTETVSVATRGGNALAFPVAEVPVLKAPGKGVTGIKIKDDEAGVLAFELVRDPADGAKVTTTMGREVVVSHKAYGGARGARGAAVIKRGGFEGWAREPMLWLGPGKEVDEAPAATTGEEE